MNKFTTMFHKKTTNKITRVLIYAILEWTLISLLLLNSLFSYLILKFAQYFGLKPPCLLCSRLDHFLDPHKKKNRTFLSYGDLICEQHASEISTIGYCSHHRKLVESRNICGDCSEIGMVRDDANGVDDDDHDHDHDDGDVKRCSCCDVPYVNAVMMIKERDQILEGIIDLDGCDLNTGDLVINQRDQIGFDSDIKFRYQVLDDADVALEPERVPLLNTNDVNNEIITHNLCPDMLPQHLEFYIDHDDYRLIPVQLVDNSVKVEEKGKVSQEIEFVLEGDELLFGCDISKNLPIENEKENPVENLQICQAQAQAQAQAQEEVESPAKDEEMVQGSEEGKIESSPTLQDQEDEKMEDFSQISQSHQEEKSDVPNLPLLQDQEETSTTEIMPILQGQEEDKAMGTDSKETTEISSIPSESKEEIASHLRSDEIDAERNQVSMDKMLIQVEEPPTACKHENLIITNNVVYEVFTSSTNLPSIDEHDGKHTEDEEEISEQSLNANLGLSHNEIEEERIPDTPTSTESLLHLHKKLQLLGRRESVTEESLDGSMISEVEGSGEGVAIIEKLKSQLQAEKNALRTLYSELEEERNASAIAANQTMAMINRLQEEKASMQMEALQYQRMMEEQSEYDQEALQMMNELMVKREKEKQELEKELEAYRKKVMDYEEREKMRLCKRRRNSSASCSYGEESDGLSIDLNHDDSSSPHSHEENGHQNTPNNDAVLSLQDSLASFEDERQAILDQLKVLEEKLFVLAEEEVEHIENMKPFDQFYEENGGENGFSHVNGKNQQERMMNGSMPKRLLPLFDATELLESQDEELDGFDSMNKSPVTKFELEKKRLEIVEEVDHVYERLQALEADREFLKHCIGSLRKGDKGLDLLQEILQHLRDLKSVELQAMKNMDHCVSDKIFDDSIDCHADGSMLAARSE